MTLSAFLTALEHAQRLEIYLPDGNQIPAHFHITEVGQQDRLFVDCGGTVRRESVVNFQLYTADDYDHRLSSQKLKSIVLQSKKQLNLSDALEVRVEYQGRTIETFGLEYSEDGFEFVSLQTDCLAKDGCGIPEKSAKPKVALTDLQQSSCTPGSGCC